MKYRELSRTKYNALTHRERLYVLFRDLRGFYPEISAINAHRIAKAGIKVADQHVEEKYETPL